MMDTKEWGQLTSNYTYFEECWLSGVENYEEAMDEGVDYCGPENTIHKVFGLDISEKLMKYWTGGSYIIMKSTPRVPADI